EDRGHRRALGCGEPVADDGDAVSLGSVGEDVHAHHRVDGGATHGLAQGACGRGEAGAVAGGGAHGGGGVDDHRDLARGHRGETQCDEDVVDGGVGGGEDGVDAGQRKFPGGFGDGVGGAETVGGEDAGLLGAPRVVGELRGGAGERLVDPGGVDDGRGEVDDGRDADRQVAGEAADLPVCEGAVQLLFDDRHGVDRGRGVGVGAERREGVGGGTDRAEGVGAEGEGAHGGDGGGGGG